MIHGAIFMENARHTVLIVDDEPDMCWALQNLLSAKGFDSKAVQTGEGALILLETTGFEIALLDVKLPDIDGLELARRMKSVVPSITIIMISGYYYKDDVDIQCAVEEGLVKGFLAKPFLHEDVIKVVEAAVADT